MRQLVIGLALCLIVATSCAAAPPAAAPTPTAAVSDKPAPAEAPSPHDVHPYPFDSSLQATSLAYLPDGRWVLAGYFTSRALHAGIAWDTWTAAWNIETGERTILPTGGAGMSVGFGGPQMPPEGFTTAGGKLTAVSNHGKVVVSNEKKEILATLPGGGPAAFSPDGKHLAAADTRGIVRIWDWKAGRLVRTLRLDDRKGNTFLAAAIQCPSEFGQPEKNRGRLAESVRRAAAMGANVVVLPETSVTGYTTADLKKTWQVDKRPLSEGLEGVDPSKVAETVPGPSTEFFAKIAGEYGIYLTVPLLEIDPKTGHYFNTSVLLGPDGKILIHYRKVNPWPWAEQGWATDGDLGNPTVDTPWGRLAVLICFDIHKQAEIVAAKKIDTLLYSIAWVENADSQWFAKNLPAVAKKSGFNIVAANWTIAKDPAPDWHGYGQSRIIDAQGKILADLKDLFESGIVFAELPVPGP